MQVQRRLLPYIAVSHIPLHYVIRLIHQSLFDIFLKFGLIEVSYVVRYFIIETDTIA